MKKSLIIGMHDGLKYLDLVLPSLTNLGIYEIIFVLDMIKKNMDYVSKIEEYDYGKSKITILHKRFAIWKYRPCETFKCGIDESIGDLIYVSAEDIILDKDNFKDEYWKDEKIGIVDFRYYQRDPFKFSFHVFWDNLIIRISDKFGYGSVKSGIYGIRRNVYDMVGGLKDSSTEEDWLRMDVINSGFKHLHIKTTRNYHLRPNYNKDKQIMQGISRREQGFKLCRVIAHSLLHFKFWVLYGYLFGGNEK